MLVWERSEGARAQQAISGGFSSFLWLALVTQISTFNECTGNKEHMMGLVRSSQNIYQLLYLFSFSEEASFRDMCLFSCNQIPYALSCWLKIDLRMLCFNCSILVCQY